MNLFLRKRMVLAAGAVSLMALYVLSPLEAIAGGAGGGGVAGGGGTEASLSYDPFAGDVVGQGSFSRELGLSQFAPVFPAGTINDITADFFGSAYAAAQDRQHLGIDVAAPAGSDVVSPVYGEIIFNNTSIADGWGAYVVIEDFNTGWQHIVGHIASDVEVGSTVAVGEVIGSIRTAGTGPHVHWGVNSDVVGAQGFDSADQQWGWGRAPESASISEATDRGWIDPLDLL